MMTNQLNVLAGNQFGLEDIEEQFSERDLSGGLPDLAGKRVMFRTDFSKELIPIQSFCSTSSGSLPYAERGFAPDPQVRTIIGIDSSCVLVGETDDGAIYAGRVTTVSAKKGKILGYYRAGPAIFYLNPTTVKSMIGNKFQKNIVNVILNDKRVAERFIRLHLERSAQLRAAAKLSVSIVLVDGALRPSILERICTSLKVLENMCLQHFNQLVGFSKASSLKIISGAAGMLQSLGRGSLFLDVTESVKAFLPGLVRGDNKITVARFSQSSPVFRVDFSSSNSEDESQVLADLKFNDFLFRGYPETLRLAHHLSVFDSSTISSVRSYLSKKYGLIPIPSDDLRSTILGKLV